MDNLNDISFFGSELKTGVSINNEEDMYNYDEEDEVSDADEKNEMETYERVLFRENGELYEKWKKQDDKSIVVESLIKGIVSLGFTFLRNRSFNKPDDELDEEFHSESDIIDFESFKKVAFLVIYEHFASGDFPTATKMIENLGEDLIFHMRELAFHTLDTNIRNYLIKELKRMNQLSEDELSLVEFLQLLEELYPDISIEKVLEKISPFGVTNPFIEDYDEFTENSTSELVKIGDMNDMAEFTHNAPSRKTRDDSQASRLIASSSSYDDVVFKRKRSSSRLRSGSISTTGSSLQSTALNRKFISHQRCKASYFVGKLSWIKKWDQETRERILLEKDYHDNESLESKLKFCLAHHDYVGLVKWTKGILHVSKKRTENVSCFMTDGGDVIYTPENATTRRSHASPLVEECQQVIEMVRRQLKYCTPIMKELLLNGLALRGLFIKEETRDFNSLLKRFTSTYQLFSNKTNVSLIRFENDPMVMFDTERDSILAGNNPVHTTALHPIGQLSKFHTDFIKFATEKNLPSTCFRYIDRYELWDHLDSFLSPDGPQWLRLFMLSKKQDVFQLSLINARVLNNRDNDHTEEFNLNTVLAEDPLMALSTQMYSDTTIQQALQESQTIHSLNRTLLSKATMTFPTLHHALFGEKVNDDYGLCNVDSAVQEGEIHLSQYEVSRGDLYSHKKDVSLFEMVKQGHLNEVSIEDILSMDELGGEEDNHDFFSSSGHKFKNKKHRDDLFNFTEDPSNIVDTMDVAYYLINKRPMEAFKTLISDYKPSEMDETYAMIMNDTYSPVIFEKQHDKSIADYISRENQQDICEKVRKIALNNFEDQAITSSCKMFIDMCAFQELSQVYSTAILVETKVARRIVDFHPSFKLQNTGEQNIVDYLNPIRKLINDFLSIDLTIESKEKMTNSPQFRILKMLEEATESMLIVDISVKEFMEKEYSKNSHSHLMESIQILDGMKYAGNHLYVSPWKLVYVFSEVHHLPSYVNQLKSSATKGQWIAFLHHAQDISLPLDTVLAIAQENIPEPINQFLVVVLRQMKAKRDEVVQFVTIEENSNDVVLNRSKQGMDAITSAFFEILKAEEMRSERKMTSIVENLLNKALLINEPLLAIVATCYIEQDPLNVQLFACMRTWLTSQKQKLGSDVKKSTETVTLSKLNVQKILETIEKQIQDYCSNNFLKDEKAFGVQHIIYAFQLFDPKNPIISFLKFYESFAYGDYERGFEELQKFVMTIKEIQQGNFTTPFKIGDSNWLGSTSTALAQQLSRYLNTQYKRMKYLQLLHETQFSLVVDVSSEFESMYSMNCLLEKVMKLGLMEESDQLNVFTGQPHSFIEILINHNCFKEARQVAVMYRKKINYSTDKITLSQALDTVQKVRNTFLSSFDLISAYYKVNDLFIKHRYPQEDGGRFFLDQVMIYQNELTISQILNLLDLSLSWFSGTHFRNKKTEVSTRNSVQPCKTAKDLEFMRQSITLLSNSFDLEEDKNQNNVSSILQSLSNRLLENGKKTAVNPNIDELIEKVIDSLLLKGQYEEAKKISSYYSYQSSILEMVEVALSLANGTKLKVKTMSEESSKINSFASNLLPRSVYKPLKEYMPNLDEIDDVQQILDKFYMLCYGIKSRGCRYYFKVIALNYKIGRILQLSYENVVTQENFEILKLLLRMYGKEKLKICSTFIQLRNLDVNKAAAVCASYLFSTYVDYYRNEDESIFKSQDDAGTEILIEDYFMGAGGGGSDTTDDSADDRLSTSSGSSGFDFSTSYSASVTAGSFFKQSMMEKNKKNTSKTNVKENQKLFDLVKCTLDEFAEFANICRDPSAVANHLIQLLDDEEDQDDALSISSQEAGSSFSFKRKKKQLSSRISLKCKVGIITRAYHCYHMSSSFEGIDSILKRIKGPILQEILEEQDFSLIVHLLISIPDFTELTFLFDVLIENEQFELILKKNSHTDHEGNNQLKMALSSYVQTKFPEQNEKLAMVYLRFNMLKEYGAYLYNKGCKGVKKIHKRLTDKEQPNASPQSFTNMDDHVPLEHVMKIVCENFESASSSLTKEDCCQTAVRATNLSALVKLQAKFYHEAPNKKKLQTMPMVLELTPKEARTFIQNHTVFEESLIVANAYDINTMSDWIEPIYNNCIKKGDIEYLNALKSHLPTSSNLFREISKRIKQEKPVQSKSFINFRAFLLQCTDQSVVMDITGDLSLYLSHQIQSGTISTKEFTPVLASLNEMNKQAIHITDFVPPVSNDSFAQDIEQEETSSRRSSDGGASPLVQ